MMSFLLLLCSICFVGNSESFFALVVDAGSKGSRMLIFEFSRDSLMSDLAVPKIYALKSIHPGISSFALNPSNVEAALQSLIDFAVHKLEAFEHMFAYYPLYLLGTAGVRDLLPVKRDAVMFFIDKVLSASPFSFHTKQATVISGEAEAAFAWLTLNIQTLSENGFRDSIGVIDLGGASLQVAFVPTKGHYVLEHFFPMDIQLKNPISLYAKSYLHFGAIEANRRLDAMIISDALLTVESLSQIDNPCFNSGMEYVPDFASDSFQIPIQVKMRGAGNFFGCESLVKRLFVKTSECWVKECTFGGVYQPRTQGRTFAAISTIGKVAISLGLGKESSLEEFKKIAQKVCSIPHEKLSKTYSKVKDIERDSFCFNAVYVYTLLTYGLGFPEDLPSSQIQFISDEDVHDPRSSTDWAFGAIVWQVNRLKPKVINAFLDKTSQSMIDYSQTNATRVSQHTRTSYAFDGLRLSYLLI